MRRKEKKWYVCPRCNKKRRKLHKCRDGIKRCSVCARWYTSNRFYVPLEERKLRFNTTDREILYKSFINQGLNPEQASKRVNQYFYYMKKEKARRKGLRQMEKFRKAKDLREAKEQKKAFVEGLKNG